MVSPVVVLEEWPVLAPRVRAVLRPPLVPGAVLRLIPMLVCEGPKLVPSYVAVRVALVAFELLQPTLSPSVSELLSLSLSDSECDTDCERELLKVSLSVVLQLSNMVRSC